MDKFCECSTQHWTSSGACDNCGLPWPPYKIPDKISLKEAFELTITLFKECQDERDKFRDLIHGEDGYIASQKSLVKDLEEKSKLIEKLYAMRGAITKNDARTFGDLMIENKKFREALEFYSGNFDGKDGSKWNGDIYFL